MARLPIAFVLVLAAGAAGCSCGDGGGGTMADGGARDGRVVRVDAAGRDGMVGIDAPPVDPCEGVMCPPFESCIDGICEPFGACAGDGSCPESGDVCRARRCIPGDADIDGDGVPARDDCDETNPEVSPMAPEVCNAIDDNCDMMIDEGDPIALCMSDPSGGECIMGGCGCPAGRFNLDGLPGCECDGTPVASQGVACADAIDLGALADTAATMTQTGNVLPDDREVWYRFRAVDNPDDGGACDQFHARVQLLGNPDDAFEFTVFKNSCTEVQCGDMGFTDWNTATDFFSGGLGECPCRASPGMGENQCADQSADYFVRVRRRPGRPVTCAGYSLEISNGVF
jgi:hypothetical protein